MSPVKITLIGGPTALIEVGGFRLLTDPTFDAPGDYPMPHVTLTKTGQPALTPLQIGHIDAVLLSHDQHADNLDHTGRAILNTVGQVFTTVVGAGRLQGGVQGLAPWDSRELTKPDGSWMRITATPARHGPVGIEPFAGEVIGFVLTFKDDRIKPIYLTGDTVWYDGVAEVARRFQAGIVMPFAGSARTRGPFNLTMNVNDVIETADAFPGALVVPLHYEGWAHFTEGRGDLEKSFAALGFSARLKFLEPGVATPLPN